MGALVVLKCSSDPSSLPTEFLVEVEIVPRCATFAPQDDIAALVTNLSSGPVYLDLQCLPTLERLQGGAWVEASLPLRLGCANELRAPIRIISGGSMNLEVGRRFLSSGLVPGHYRFRVLVGANERDFATHRSVAFEITG